MSVSNDHFAELCAIVSEVIDTGNVVSHCIVNLVKGISDHRASDVADVERLCNVRGGIFHDYRFSFSYVGLAVVSTFFKDIFHNIFYEFFLGNEHIYVRIYLFYLFKHAIFCNFLCDAFCDERRRFAECFSKFEARERIVPHL